jgi:putative acetyltransferase
MRIVPGDFDEPQVVALLQLHLAGMHANSPVCSVHALDLTGLRSPGISFYTALKGETLVGMGAIKELDPATGEIKSMRTVPAHLRTGVGAAILDHLLGVARARGYRRVSLETGTGAAFEPALALYRKRGFRSGEPFGDYAATSFNQFLHLDLAAPAAAGAGPPRATTVVRRADLAGRITVDTITLDHAARLRRRIAMTTDRGHDFLLDLAEATHLAHGDALEFSNGSLVKVVAAAEELLEVHAHDAAALARIAWHIGNRHTPCEVTATALYIQPDHVLAGMVEGLGGHVHRVKRPFEPEGGAYGGKGPLAHGHSHQHGHAHDHVHARNEAPPRPAPRVWRPE